MQSSLAAVALRDLAIIRATDVIGGYACLRAELGGRASIGTPSGALLLLRDG